MKFVHNEIEFESARLTFNGQERVMQLLESFQSQSPLQRFPTVRELMSLCLAGWSLPDPITTWPDRLNMEEAMQVVEAAISNNATSEDDRKK